MPAHKLYPDRVNIPVRQCSTCDRKCRSKRNPPKCNQCAPPLGKKTIYRTGPRVGVGDASDSRLDELAARAARKEELFPDPRIRA